MSQILTYFCVILGGNKAMDMNTDPGCVCNMDPDMVLGCSPGLDVTRALLTAQVTHIGIDAGVPCPQDVALFQKSALSLKATGA